MNNTLGRIIKDGLWNQNVVFAQLLALSLIHISISLLALAFMGFSGLNI